MITIPRGVVAHPSTPSQARVLHGWRKGPSARRLVLTLTAALLACGGDDVGPAADTAAAVRATHWGTNVTITSGDGTFRYRSNSRPNHMLNAQYVMPDNFTTCVPHPTAACTHIEQTSEAVAEVPIDVTITTRPQKVTRTFSLPFGAMGVMISGSPVYNPFEGDGTTVAMAANFTLTNAEGQQVPFMDACHAHPSPHPQGQYHYHALSPCVTAQVDQVNGPSHIIGYAFDGFPIYGDRDVNGAEINPATLDECNGIESPTPEFPAGIYHYVLLHVHTVQSTIRCLHGRLDFPVLPHP
jgi:hypothetical protein